VLVVGGGSGGISVAAKLSYRFGAGNVTILEASDVYIKMKFITFSRPIDANLLFIIDCLETLLSATFHIDWWGHEELGRLI
jgi:choline dehydrogenase-like flavoprotein